MAKASELKIKGVTIAKIVKAQKKIFSSYTFLLSNYYLKAILNIALFYNN